MGWNPHVHREFPGMFESSKVSRDNVSRGIGRTHPVSFFIPASMPRWHTASFRKFNLEKWVQPLGDLNKGHVEVKNSNGAGIWDTQFESLRIEIMRTDRTLRCENSWKCRNMLKPALGMGRSMDRIESNARPIPFVPPPSPASFQVDFPLVWLKSKGQRSIKKT